MFLFLQQSFKLLTKFPLWLMKQHYKSFKQHINYMVPQMQEVFFANNKK